MTVVLDLDDMRAHAPAAHDARLTSSTRLAALQASGLLEGRSSPVLDRLARLGRDMLQVPIGLVSLVDDQRQHFAGMAGLGGRAGAMRGTPLSHSFCQHVVTRNAPLIVTNARHHSLLSANPAVDELGVIAYAGVPLRTAHGETLGAMCAMDSAPLEWSDRQVGVLADLAAAAVAEIELRITMDALLTAQYALRLHIVQDPLTGLLNRRGFADEAQRHVAQAARTGAPFMIAALDLDGFKRINDTFGHDAGDEAIVELASILLQLAGPGDVIARMGGDEFVMLLRSASERDGVLLEDRLGDLLASRNTAASAEFHLAASIGFACWRSGSPASLPSLLRRAEEEMYANKRDRAIAASKVYGHPPRR
ncbi:MAG: sensor domain-containing diguanylate cyclase [Gemmatimonadota bacterium]